MSSIGRLKPNYKGVPAAVTNHMQGLIDSSRSYLRDSASSLEEGRVDTAGELLWKSMEAAVKAVAASRGLSLRSESNVWNYAAVLEESMDQRGSFQAAFHGAYSLWAHDSWYGLTPEQWHLLRENIASGVEELLDLASRGSRR